MPPEKKVEWKNTLNLPQTAFPMKAQLSQNEPKMLERWEKAGIYGRILDSRRDKPLFILHDGPPYANGMIHLGTALNKILKDFVVKSHTMAGFQAPYVPGWDCHGLPIEHKVDQQLGAKRQKMGKIEVREECRRYAERFIDLQRTDFKRLGIFGDWENPYTTIDPGYEAGVVRFFNSFVRKGNVYRKKRPVYWCTSCQTALAEAEVEYHDHSSPSITVKFKLEDIPAILKKHSGEEIFVLIWTTTPWTIPANLAIAVHPEYDYSLFRLGGELYIAASRLVPVIAEQAGQPFEKLAEFKGAELNGLHARHPLCERDSLLINTDYVLLDQGTGCVHTAPGHGDEDYQAGIAHGLDIYSPVGPDGRFDESAGTYHGQFVHQANAGIVADLAAARRLLHSESYVHSYPHCWRCKNPVIFRATEQWFIAIDTADLRRRALSEIGKVAWLPAWGEERIASMIANRPDWCISRQRDWGVPLPVFFCASCQRPLLDPDTIEKVAEVFARHGSNVWWEKAAADFVPDGTACPGCGGRSFEKGQDIVDVWFESGSSHGILERTAGHRWPADVYLEGGDQYRGWFHSSLLVGVSAHGRAPYRTVITHGWTLDAEGRAMSKSLGNTVEPAQIAREQGAEILRLWVAMVNYQEDVWFGDEIQARVGESYRKIRNTWRFMLGVLGEKDPQTGATRMFDPARDSRPESDFSALDRYILQRFAEIKARVLRAYREFEYTAIYHALFNFFTVDLSALYLNVQKDNLYCNRREAPERRAVQTVVFRLLHETLRLLAPVLSFTAEEAWQHLPGFPGKEESVHVAFFPEAGETAADAAAMARWEKLLAWRERALKEIEEARSRKEIGDSLEARVEIRARGDDLALLQAESGTLRNLLVVSALEVGAGDDAVQVRPAGGRKCPRCWNRFDDPPAEPHPDLCPRCRRVVTEDHLDPAR